MVRFFHSREATALRSIGPTIAWFSLLSVMPGAWTAGVPLPGGDFPVAGVEALRAELRRAYPFLTEAWAARLQRAYGTDAALMLGTAQTPEDLGPDFGATLTAAEVRWLMRHEYARTAEDVVWRRTKLGLRLDAERIAALDDWMAGERATQTG